MSINADLDADIERLTAELQTLQYGLKTELVTEDPWWSTSQAMTMSAIVLVFGIIVILTIAYLIQKGKNPDELLKIFGTSLIIVMAIFLVVAGYSDQQIAPVMGLMGTIAGYLLGKGTKSEKEDNPTK